MPKQKAIINDYLDSLAALTSNKTQPTERIGHAFKVLCLAKQINSLPQIDSGITKEDEDLLTELLA